MFTLAACGGGSSSVPAVTPTAAPTSTPTPKPAATPAPVTQSATVPVSSAPETAALPVVGGYTPIALFPSSSAAADATIAAVSTTQAPTGLTALQDLSRQIASTRIASETAPTVYLYEALTASSTISFSSMPFFTLGLPSSVVTAANAFYMAMLAPGSAQWQLDAAGPAAVNGQALTFAPPANSSLTLIEGQTLWLAFYSLPAGSTPQPAPSTTPTVSPSATPSAAPTSTPNGNPSGGLALSTSSITLNAAGATATFVATENNYSGGFVASSGDTNVATVTQGIKGSFTVTAVAAGTTTITVSDNHGGSASIAVTVTTTGVTIH